MSMTACASFLRYSLGSKISPCAAAWRESLPFYDIYSLDHRTTNRGRCSSGVCFTQAAGAAARFSGGFSRWSGRLVKADMASRAAASAGLRNVFVYGSLLAEEVLSILLKRVPQGVDAIVENFHRFSIRDRVYPAAVPFDGRTIAGKILLELTDDELKILDEFESTEYIRMVVEPKVVGDMNLGKEATNFVGTFPAFIYAWEDAKDENLFGDWDYEEWRRNHLKDFLAMCDGFISEFTSF